jgi:serine/threonine protein kinase
MDLSSEEGVIRKAHSFEGQSLLNSWEPLKFKTLNTLNNNGNPKLSNFDARCSGNIFIIQKRLETIFSKYLKNTVELFPIFLNEDANNFLFVNVIDVVKAINTENLGYTEIMQRFRTNTVNFFHENVKDKLIFRDIKANNILYCTEKFISFINDENILGLEFECAGFAG